MIFFSASRDETLLKLVPSGMFMVISMAVELKGVIQ